MCILITFFYNIFLQNKKDYFYFLSLIIIFKFLLQIFLKLCSFWLIHIVQHLGLANLWTVNNSHLKKKADGYCQRALIWYKIYSWCSFKSPKTNSTHFVYSGWFFFLMFYMKNFQINVRKLNNIYFIFSYVCFWDKQMVCSILT